MAQPGIPGTVIGRVHAIGPRLTVQEILQLDEKVRVHQLGMFGQVPVQGAIDQPQFIDRMDPHHRLATFFKTHSLVPEIVGIYVRATHRELGRY